MKKIFTLIFVLFCSYSYSQVIRASIGVGTQPNRAKIYLKPTVTQTPSSISTLQFNVGVDATGLLVAPTLTVVSSTLGSAASWLHDIPPYNEGGYWNYNLYTTASPLTPNLTLDTEFEAIEIEFTNGSPNMANVALITLPDGGSFPSLALFYCTGTVNSNGLSDLYYARTGVTVDNQNSYDPTGGTPGTAISTVVLTSSLTIVPVRFTSFDVVKKDNDAILNWKVENESSISDRYEVERSLDKNNFTKIGTITAWNNGNSSNNYTTTDHNLSAVRTSGIIYYRIKQVDKDGNSVYTEIKSVKMSSGGFNVSVYPNPVANNSGDVYIDLANADQIKIKLIDVSGKTIKTETIDGIKGLNTYTLQMNKLAAGTYILQVEAGRESKSIPVVKNK